MADFNSTYKYEEKEDTEWDILQRKHGNLPPREPQHRPAPWAPREDEAEIRKEKVKREREEGGGKKSEMSFLCVFNAMY